MDLQKIIINQKCPFQRSFEKVFNTECKYDPSKFAVIGEYTDGNLEAGYEYKIYSVRNSYL